MKHDEINMQKANIAKAGSLLCVDKGAYSDYQVCGFFVVLHDFDPIAELEEYLNAHPKQRKDYLFEEMAFLSTLLKKGALLEIEYGTLYLSDYERASDVCFKPFHVSDD